MADWQAGDLALCIAKGFTERGKSSPIRPGSVHKVVLVDRWPFLNLVFDEYPNFGFDAGDFRKITPGADIEGIEERRRVPVEA